MKGVTTALLLALLAAAPCAAGCQEALECGGGTRLEAGICVLEREPERAACGFGTVFDEAADQCLPIFAPTTCGEASACDTSDEGYYECNCNGVGGEDCP